jgi:hypothetical protein
VFQKALNGIWTADGTAEYCVAGESALNKQSDQSEEPAQESRELSDVRHSELAYLNEAAD